jgi:hypothetical protein
LERLGNHLLTGLWIGDIGQLRQDSLGPSLLREPLQFSLLSRSGYYYGCTFMKIGISNGPSHASACPRHDCDLPIEFPHL